MPPIVRSAVFDTYWRFAAERQAVFNRRRRGEPAPWTADPILRAYKFCNAYRASDRVSQFLIRHVIYQPGLSAEDTLLRIILFRLFSRIETWQRLEAAHGAITRRSFDPDAYSETLDRARGDGRAIYTSAFILSPGRAHGTATKHRHHLALIDAMLRNGLVKEIAHASSLGSLCRLLLPYPTIGPFLAYQLAIDINYSELTDFAENEFSMPGPGAMRGIQKCFVSTGSWSMERIIFWTVERQQDEFRRMHLDFQPLGGRSLQAIDCQNLFCEVDKYARVAFPELPSNRTRIKTRFVPSSAPIPYFYPPKWGINDAFMSPPSARISSESRHPKTPRATARQP